MRSFLSAPLAGLAALLACATTQADAAVTVFTDRDAFLAALADAEVASDGLDAPVTAGDAVALPLGITSRNSLGNRLPGDNGVSGGELSNALAGNALLASGLNELLLPGGAVAFGAAFGGVGGDLPLLDDASITLGVVVDGVAQSFDLQSLFGGADDGFFGLISDGDDLGAVLLTNGSGVRNAFTIDEVFVANALPVPVPAGLPLFAVGTALAFSARKRAR